jgi:hypothetical protein
VLHVTTVKEIAGMKPSVALTTLTILLAPPLGAQSASRVFLEARGGAAVPTFNIADAAKTGTALGATLGLALAPRWVLMGEFDYGMHSSKLSGAPDLKTLHYLAKLGYSLTGPRETGWEVLVNLGAGAVSFDPDGSGPTRTYFAINAGAKLAYGFTPSVALVLSPQGDIAFSKESELGASTAWVWPVTVGLRIRF